MKTKTTHELVEILMMDYHEIYKGMVESDHNFSEVDEPLEISLYHGEGSVWTHTCMVMAMADLLYPEDYINKIACLVHDFGKPLCRSITNRRGKECVSFHGHSGVSSFVAKKFLEDPRLGLSTEEIILIHRVVNLHIDVFQGGLLDTSGEKTILTETGAQKFKHDPALFRQLIRLTHCDGLGMVSGTPQVPNLHADLLDVADSLDLYNQESTLKTTRTLHMLIGPAGVGKSSYRDKFTNAEAFISRDDTLMTMYPGGTYSEAWKKQDSKAVDCKVTQTFIDCIHDNKDIVVDMTSLSVKSRNKFISQIPETYEKVAHVFICDYVELYRRVKNRGIDTGKTISPEVILTMMKGFSIPTCSEFDQVKFIFN